MYRSSDSHYKSWTSRSTSHSVPSHPSASPGPMPSAPHLHSVSLPHPNSAPRYDSSSSPGSQYYHQGSSGILALNPLLSVSTGVLPMYFNVTQDVQYIQFRPESQNLLDTPAVHPPCPRLVLSVPALPLWSTIEVRNLGPSGVTARDVLVRIRDVLNRGASSAEMSTMGVKRIDFLGPNVLFAGLSRSWDGQDRWEVHFVPRT